MDPMLQGRNLDSNGLVSCALFPGTNIKISCSLKDTKDWKSMWEDQGHSVLGKKI